MNITESNKLIAEFMGMKKHHNDNSMMVKITSQGNEVVLIDTLQYHSSWDWLMPVVEKIQKLYQECMYHNNQIYKDYYYKVLDKGISTTREIIYKSVVEFIKEYNELNN